MSGLVFQLIAVGRLGLSGSVKPQTFALTEKELEAAFSASIANSIRRSPEEAHFGAWTVTQKDW
jgi:hypothetical protein